MRALVWRVIPVVEWSRYTPDMLALLRIGSVAA
jgi:hypothetical protein